ncbi:MAG: hypothetical protein KF709_10025 [Gemmatimonadaceae bacterium]|nr:hypothetical protein [Gemmatimonadaceae bacterium]
MRTALRVVFLPVTLLVCGCLSYQPVDAAPSPATRVVVSAREGELALLAAHPEDPNTTIRCTTRSVSGRFDRQSADTLWLTAARVSSPRGDESPTCVRELAGRVVRTAGGPPALEAMRFSSRRTLVLAAALAAVGIAVDAMLDAIVVIDS